MAQQEERWVVPPPRYYSAEQVREVLTWPMVNKAIEEAMWAVFITNKLIDQISSPYVSQTAISESISRNGEQLFTSSSYVSNYCIDNINDGGGIIDGAAPSTKTLVSKLVTSFPPITETGRQVPNILANILLFNTTTGHLECIMEATQITAWRTAAASIIATKYIYFWRLCLNEKQHKIKVAILGCGGQGGSHALGMCATYQVTDIYLFSRRPEKASRIAELLREAAPNTTIHIATTVREAVAQADVICKGVSKPLEQVLIKADMLKRNVHINVFYSVKNGAAGASNVHAGEFDQEIYDKALIYGDCMHNANIERDILKLKVVDTVGSLIRKCPPLNSNCGGISIFHSVGMPAEDATLGQAIYDALRSRNAAN